MKFAIALSLLIGLTFGIWAIKFNRNEEILKLFAQLYPLEKLVT